MLFYLYSRKICILLETLKNKNILSLHRSVWGLRTLCLREARADNPAWPPIDKGGRWDPSNTKPKRLCRQEKDKLDPTDSRRFSRVGVTHFLQWQMAKNRCSKLEEQTSGETPAPKHGTTNFPHQSLLYMILSFSSELDPEIPHRRRLPHLLFGPINSLLLSHFCLIISGTIIITNQSDVTEWWVVSGWNPIMTDASWKSLNCVMWYPVLRVRISTALYTVGPWGIWLLTHRHSFHVIDYIL